MRSENDRTYGFWPVVMVMALSKLEVVQFLYD